MLYAFGFNTSNVCRCIGTEREREIKRDFNCVFATCVLYLFLTVPYVVLHSVIVAFPGHTLGLTGGSDSIVLNISNNSFIVRDYLFICL